MDGIERLPRGGRERRVDRYRKLARAGVDTGADGTVVTKLKRWYGSMFPQKRCLEFVVIRRLFEQKSKLNDCDRRSS